MKIFTKDFGYLEKYRSRLRDQNYSVNMHIHQYSELIYVFEGKILLTVDGKNEILEKGNAALITPFQIHMLKTLGRAKFYICVFSASCVPDYSKEVDFFYNRESSIFHPSKELSEMIEGMAKLMPLYITHTYTPLPRKIKAILYTAFCEYTDCNKEIASIKKRDVLSKLFLYLNDHFTEDITLSSVGKILGYNPKYLSQCLSSIPDMNFSLILNSLRVDYSKVLLTNRNMKIIDIAYESGFKSEQSYHRAFLKLAKMTPGEYRRRLQK